MIYATSEGFGPHVIVFIHGNSSDHSCWYDTIKYLPENVFTCITVDLPGHGLSLRSPNPDSDYSLRGMAKHVKEFLHSNNTKPYIIVGVSLAANIVGEIARDLPNCRGIMLLGSTVVGKGLALNDVVLPNPNVAVCFSESFTDDQLDSLITDAAFSLSDPVKQKVSETFRNTDPKVRSALANAVFNKEYADGLLNIEQSNLPLAVVYGEQEKICKTDALNVCGLKLWGSKPVTIKHSGHFSHLDQPEIFSKLVDEFAKYCFR
jgi:pimeloyl-ACP methyl ester carboxylesterase